MKRTIILTLGAIAAVLVAGYLTGADDPPAAPNTANPATQQVLQQPLRQPTQQPAVETEEFSEGFLILTSCPMCHTCPVCQANCGTSHAMKCCVGKKKPGAMMVKCEGDECCEEAGSNVRHVMTNKADAVKHAATHVRSSAAGQGTPQTMQTGTGIVIIETDD